MSDDTRGAATAHETTITQLVPAPSGMTGGTAPAGPLDDDALWGLYSPAERADPRIRVNFVESLDGSATVAGLSGELGGTADKRVFDILRALADVVLVGAGTARAEGYGALRMPDALARRRREAGLDEHPAMALVSGSLDLDPASELFTKAPSRPIVYTVESAPPAARRRIEAVAEVVLVGAERADPIRIRSDLLARGLPQVLCEGGPSLFGDLIAADLVDELCLTMSPTLEGGAGRRIAAASDGTAASPRGLELAHLLQSGSVLLTRWTRTRG